MKNDSTLELEIGQVDGLLAAARREDALFLLTSASLDSWAGGPKVPPYPSFVEALNAHPGEGKGPCVARGQSFRERLRETGVPQETIFWIEAADLFEQLLLEGARRQWTHVFVLDPWAASLVGKANPLAGANWIYLFHRSEGGSPHSAAYGQVLGEWALHLPFQGKLPIHESRSVSGLVERGISDSAPNLPTPRPRSNMPPRFKKDPCYSEGERSGEEYIPWRWKVIGPASGRRADVPMVAVVVQGANRPLHLRILVDSLVRQNYPLHRIRLQIQSDAGDPSFPSFLAAVRCAHPALEVGAADSEAGGPLGRGGLTHQLESSDVAVVLDGRTLLPPGFLAILRELVCLEEPLSVPQIELRRDVSSHILLGNLDYFEQYGALHEAHRSALLAEPVRILPRKALRDGAGIIPLGQGGGKASGTVGRELELLRLSEL